METTFWPRVRAQRALCAAEILARAAALIVRRPPVARVLFNPLSALIAVSNALNCCDALSRSAFNCAIMSMCSPRARIVADTANYAALCINVNSARNASSNSLRSSTGRVCPFRTDCRAPELIAFPIDLRERST